MNFLVLALKKSFEFFEQKPWVLLVLAVVLGATFKIRSAQRATVDVLKNRNDQIEVLKREYDAAAKQKEEAEHFHRLQMEQLQESYQLKFRQLEKERVVTINARTDYFIQNPRAISAELKGRYGFEEIVP